MTAFLDTPSSASAEAEEFWFAVTGSTPSARRDSGTFVSFVPPAGDSYVRAQVTESGAPGVHLDLYVDDVVAEADRLIGLGATRVFSEPGLEVLRSPGGQAFCLDSWTGQSQVPAPVVLDGATASLDQVCIDIPDQLYARERSFWAAVTGWEIRPGLLHEFEWMPRPTNVPIRLLLQRTGDDASVVSAHLDFAAGPTMDDVAKATRAHVALGAEPGERHTHWQVMTDPAGRAYCLTARDPRTGRLEV